MRNFTKILMGMLLIACGGKKQEETAKVVSVEDYESSTYSVGAGEGSVEGLLGNVTQDEIERVFGENGNAMMRCYASALEDIEEIEGEVRFEIEVVSDGSVRKAFISSSDLGSIDAESCMLNRVKGFHFNRAPGGPAILYYPLILEAPYDPAEPKVWGNGDVRNVLEEHADEVDSCLKGNGGVHVTAYVGQGGMVLSAGASGNDMSAYECARCVATAMRRWVFRAPPANNLVKVQLDF